MSVSAAGIDLIFEFEPVALVERRDARALNRRNVNERIGLAVIALDEAEAFHRIEELDGPAGFLAGQLPLAWAQPLRARSTAMARPRS